MPDLTVIIPSRGRLESLRRCVNSAIALATEPPSVIVYFDDDKECYEAYNQPPEVEKALFGPERLYYVTTMNTALKDLINQEVDYFIVANNDQEFIEPGWDQIALDKFEEKFPDGEGVLEIGNHETLSYNTFISRTQFWQEHFDSQLFDPRFVQYYADTERVDRLNCDDWLARLAPGLVNTHACWDEVKHSGLEMMKRDKEAYDSL